MRASLAHGAAWIWPNSNGPRTADSPTSGSSAADPTPPYREAAVLVASLGLRGGGVEHGGRTRPLQLPAGVRLLPVVHVEAAADAPDEFSPSQREAVLAAVRRHAPAAAAGAGWLQLDFEAPARQWPAYGRLLAAVREALPPQVRLSITALAHWCLSTDRWLDALPVDEVVPMLYQLGPHAELWRRRLADGDAALAQRCRGPAMGFATAEPPPPALLTRTAHPYWFDHAAWSNPAGPPRHLLP